MLMYINYKNWNLLRFEIFTGIILGLFFIVTGLLNILSTTTESFNNFLVLTGFVLIITSFLHYHAMKNSEMSKDTLKEKDWFRNISSLIYAFLITGMILGVQLSSLIITGLCGLGLISYTYYKNS